MPLAYNGEVRIHYEVVGNGPPLVLQHGFTQCLEDWIECGYLAALQDHYRVILIDARGHGLSGKPRDEDSYALQLRVGDVTSVLDALGVARAHFWGYSMGGFIGWGMAQHAAHRLDALVIGGSHPYGRDPEVNRTWLRTAMAAGGDAIVTTIAGIAGHVSESYAARLRAADHEVWLACVPRSGDMSGALPGMKMRCCLYSGDADPVFAQAKAASALIPGARFVALPGLAHLPAFSESAAVLPAVMGFLAGG